MTNMKETEVVCDYFHVDHFALSLEIKWEIYISLET